MPTYGEYRRLMPRVNVLRGYPGNEPTSLTLSAPPTAGQNILSGMVISLVNGSWVKGCAKGSTPYIAYHDQTDTDVLSSGKLLGLSCAGKYEIETGWFVDAPGITVSDVPLKASAGPAAGNLEVAAGWAEDVDVIGVTSRGGKQTVTSINTQATPVGGPNYTLIFTTNWTPSRVAGA